jgi:hypothetical protein
MGKLVPWTVANIVMWCSDQDFAAQLGCARFCAVYYLAAACSCLVETGRRMKKRERTSCDGFLMGTVILDDWGMECLFDVGTLIERAGQQAIRSRPLFLYISATFASGPESACVHRALFWRLAAWVAWVGQSSLTRTSWGLGN